MNNRTKGISLAIITAVMWGIMGMFVRGLTGYAFTTFEISFFRCALAGGAYFLFLLFTKPSALKINLKGLVICLLYGAVAYSISFVSYSVAVSRIPVGVATVLMFMSPIWVAILGRFMFGEKLPKSKMVTILICLIGAVFVANLIGGGDIKLDGIGILCTMVANVSCVKSTQYVEATTTSILSALEVVVGTLVGFVVFHEHMTMLQILGAVIIVVGAIGSEIYQPKRVEKDYGRVK